MNSPGSARVLVVAADAREARHLVTNLKDHFEHVESSTNPDEAVADFEKHAPDVIVLAFKSLEQAERYYLALHRFGQSIYQRPHRTVLLCGKDEAASAFELCKKRYFDDYVLYWPNPQDGLRLAMSVWLGCRELQARRREGPTGPQLRSHATHLEDLDRKLREELEEGQRQAAAAHHSLLELERDISGVNDELSRHLMGGGANGAIEVKDAEALARELERFKSRQISHTRVARDQVIRPMESWAQELKTKVEPALKGTRALATQVRQIRPVVLVVDDDERMRDILKPVLTSLGYDVVMVASGDQALRELPHLQLDALLLDIRLQDCDGVALTRQLKSTPDLAHIPVILMSGDSRRERLMSSIEAGAVDFIAKPFTREVLRAKLEKVLGRTDPV